MQKKSLIVYISLLLAISGLMFTNGALLPHQNNTQAYGVNNGGNAATIGTRLIGTTSDSVETASAPIEMTSEPTSATNGTTGALNFTSPPQTFEEWRSFLLAWDNMTLDDLKNADPITIQTLDQEAHIYEGLVNGTYTQEQASQLLTEIHQTPIIDYLTYTSTTDKTFGFSFIVFIVVYGEHSFRVYGYMDYDRSDSTWNGANSFSDGSSEKVYGPYVYFPSNDPYPYDTLPYLSALDPATSFMGSSYDLIYSYLGHQQLGYWVYSGSTGGIQIGDHYFVVQILYKWDEFIAFTFTYKAHFVWTTSIYAVSIQDDDTTPPVIQGILVGSIVDNQARFPIGVLATDASGIDGIYFDGVYYSSAYITGLYWIDVPSPRTPGTLTGEIVVWDADTDRFGDQLSTRQTFTYTITDDDVTPPTVSWSTTSIQLSGNMIQLSFTVDATDARGIGAVLIQIGSYAFYDLGSHTVTLAPGIYLAYVSVTDADNDWSGDSMTTTMYEVIILDLSPPTTNLVLSPHFSDETGCYVTSATTCTLSATDDVTGVAVIYYRINGGDWIPYTTGFKLSGPDCAYTISYYSIDNNYNIEPVKTQTVVIDNTAPVTSVTLGGVHGFGGWFVSDVLVTLSPTDGSSGVARTLYSYDGSNWVTYDGPFAVEREGSTTVYYYSTDNVGNVEDVKTEVVNIDWAAPETTESHSGTMGLGGWYLSPVTVSLTATDDYSGVSATQYSFNGIDWDTYTGSFTVSADGLTSVYYRSIDNAGNVEGMKITQIMIDKTPPTTGITIGTHYIDGTGAIYVTSETLITLLPYDATSGVAYTLYGINLPSGDWMVYTTGFKLSGPDGAYTLTYYSVDNAGNVEVESSTLVNLVSLKVDSYIASGCFHKITQFDALFIKKGCFDGYKLVATHPGQFYYIVKVVNDWPMTLDTMTIEFSIPVDFTLKGGHPIYVFMNCHSITRSCTIQGTGITVKHVPPGSTVWIVIRLDYALKGAVYHSLADFGIREYTFSGTVSAVAGTSQVPGGGLIGTYGYGATLTAYARAVRHFLGCAAHANCHLRPNLVPGWPNHISDALGMRASGELGGCFLGLAKK